MEGKGGLRRWDGQACMPLLNGVVSLLGTWRTIHLQLCIFQIACSDSHGPETLTVERKMLLLFCMPGTDPFPLGFSIHLVQFMMDCRQASQETLKELDRSWRIHGSGPSKEKPAAQKLNECIFIPQKSGVCVHMHVCVVWLVLPSRSKLKTLVKYVLNKRIQNSHQPSVSRLEAQPTYAFIYISSDSSDYLSSTGKEEKEVQNLFPSLFLSLNFESLNLQYSTIDT